jgi:hypothetical protein
MVHLESLDRWLDVHGRDFKKFLKLRKKQCHDKQTITDAAMLKLEAIVKAYGKNSTIMCLDPQLVNGGVLPVHIGPHQVNYHEVFHTLIEFIQGQWNLDVCVKQLPLDHPVCVQSMHCICRH